MKKIFVSLFACAAMLTSCDMDTPAPGVLDDQTAINSITEAKQFRNYIYSMMRGCTSGSWVYNTELQMDQYLGLSTNGNRGGDLASGDITTSSSFAKSAFNGMYSRIANVNYYLEKTSALANLDLSEEQALSLQRYVGEAKFARAYFYFYLMDHFCQTYDASKGDVAALGMPIVITYNPTGDTSKYPGRSTMNELLNLIKNDLADAYTALKAYEDAGFTENTVAGAPYLSSYTVLAMQARVALVTSDYTTAIEKAKAVIANENYQLAVGADYVQMWADANVDELIFAPFVDQSEASSIGSFCEGWNYWWSNTTQTDYLPTAETLLNFLDIDEDGNIAPNDYRFAAYFKYTDINVQGGTTKAYTMNKFPGNPALNKDTNRYLNMPKPFRLSEQYLIWAEAAAMTNKPAEACEALNAILAARRLPGSYTNLSISGTELVEFIRAERSRELLGEGFRLSDLRRWKVAWKRDAEYLFNPTINESFVIADVKTQYEANDYRYLWPIPADEMEINPQLAGQQNPGY